MKMHQTSGASLSYLTYLAWVMQITMEDAKGRVLSTVTPISEESMLFKWKAFP